MDYKYIEQLLERYWKCETTLEEEEILRMFFSQKEVPANLLPFRDVFVYENNEKKQQVLGDDFDQKLMEMIDEPAHVKARVVTMAHRLTPLFKAAAVVAIFLTLGNAAQVAFNNEEQPATETASAHRMVKGLSVAMNDSVKTDSTLQKLAQPTTSTILK
ncbi:MAG: pyruvate ferredoxin oxidoreductase [Prevotella sp.]|nr:pyruvate ferredoxin oxidoreductase [Prevotella sp.]MDD7047003.1 pyruvate ferredoxin oxidoreductase [Prevotella sp.]MDY5546487.1 pyruvate ferredoxin oxidoreductase [Prevotella sp.]